MKIACLVILVTQSNTDRSADTLERDKSVMEEDLGDKIACSLMTVIQTNTNQSAPMLESDKGVDNNRMTKAGCLLIHFVETDADHPATVLEREEGHTRRMKDRLCLFAKTVCEND